MLFMMIFIVLVGIYVVDKEKINEQICKSINGTRYIYTTFDDYEDIQDACYVNGTRILIKDINLTGI